MLMNRKDFLTVLVVLFATCLGISTTHGQQEESERKIPLSEVPPAIRTIIERELGASTIEDIELGTKDGKKVFKVDAEAADGSELELDIAEDGTIVKKEIDGKEAVERIAPVIRSVVRPMVSTTVKSDSNKADYSYPLYPWRVDYHTKIYS